MMIIWMVVVALAALLVADPMNDYKESGRKEAFSVLMSGGQGRLKPSRGNFFVASMPIGDFAGGAWPPDYHGSKPPFLF